MANISGLLNNIKSAESGETVRDAIIQALEKINNDNPTQTKPLNVTANGTYTSETGFAYNPVTVNVPAGGSSNYTFEELNVTENGEYEPDDDNTMYNRVTVNVPQTNKELAPDGFKITQNGEYDPLLDGYDGYSKIIVAVDAATGDGPFTVQFYSHDKTTVIATQTVPKDGDASCTIYDGTSYGGLYFKGWNPEPKKVTRDLKCYPIYGDYIIDPGEIADDWDQICADGGAHYPLGSYKSLIFSTQNIDSMQHVLNNVNYNGTIYDNVVRDYTNIRSIDIAMHMVKVAEGEDGTTSSWLSTGTISFGAAGITPRFGENVSSWCDTGFTPQEGSWSGGADGVDMDWMYSFLRKYLNEYFLYCLPEALQKNIKRVNKSFASQSKAPSRGSRGSGTRVEKTSPDKIWVPSMKELHTLFATAGNYEAKQAEEESTGIDYSAVYLPGYISTSGTKFGTRTLEIGSNYYNPVFLRNINGSDLEITAIDQGCGQYPIGFCL